MSLLKIAKEKADAERKALKDKEKQEKKFMASMQKTLTELKSKVLEAMSEFDGVTCKYGKLKLVIPNQSSAHIVALKLTDRPAKVDETLLYIDAGIESGTFDGSDDCRDIPYTKARVSIYKPADNRSIYGRSYNNGTLRGCFCENIDDLNKVSKSLEKVAKYLSPLF